MGVSLSGLIPTEEIQVNDLGGRAVAIDAYNTIYQFLSIIRDRFTGEPLKDSQGRVTSHLSGLFYRTTKLLEAGVRPVFVFDGKPPEFKKETQEKRRQIKEEAHAKWKQAVDEGDVEKVRTYAQATSRLTPEMVTEAQHLLELMGISWITAPSEGEAQAAAMVKTGQVWAAGSQDWDSLMFGADRFVRNLTLSGRRKIPRKEQYVEVKPEIVRFEEVLKELGITHDQLIILGMLVGTDYNPDGIKGVGPKTALKLVKEHKTLDAVIAKTGWEAQTSPETIFDFFKNPPTENITIPTFTLEHDKLVNFMVEEHDFSQERTLSTLKKLQDKKKQGQQSHLSRFF